MTTIYRYNAESKRMEAAIVEGGNPGNGEEPTKWVVIPPDVWATMLRYAREDKLNLGDKGDSERAVAAAKGKAVKLYLIAAMREFISSRNAKAKADAEAAAAAKVEEEPKAEITETAVQLPPAAKPQSDGKFRGKQVQLVK